MREKRSASHSNGMCRECRKCRKECRKIVRFSDNRAECKKSKIVFERAVGVVLTDARLARIEIARETTEENCY